MPCTQNTSPKFQTGAKRSSVSAPRQRVYPTFLPFQPPQSQRHRLYSLSDVTSKASTHQMAAPCFTSTLTLRADLETLGCPDVDDRSVLSLGKPRIAALNWLAQQADPTFVPSTAENLAAFWDRLGIHSAAPNSAGHRIPLTAPADRPRDKNAANCFLRAAIDLVFAFRARRTENPLSDSWLNGFDETNEPEEEGPLSQFDSESLEQLDTLINQRHLLFPNTTKLMQANPSKKRPLQRRRVNTNKTVQSLPCAKKVEKIEKDSFPSREHVLERVRQVQRRANDLEAKLVERRRAREEPQSPQTDEDLTALVNINFTQLGDSTKALCELITRFERVTLQGLAARNKQTNAASRDRKMEATLSNLSKESLLFQRSTLCAFDSTKRMKNATEEIAHSKPLLEGLPESAAVQEVLRHQKRTKQHM